MASVEEHAEITPSNVEPNISIDPSSPINAPLDSVTPSSLDEPPKFVRDEAFYFRSVVFSAQNTHFKVPVYALPTEEGIFSAMFELPNENGEGSDDENPIHLPSEVGAEEFRCFLKACIPMPDVPVPKLTFDEWMNVHKLSTMWCLDKLRAKVIDSADRELSTLAHSGDRSVQKVLLGRQHLVSRWLLDGYEALGKRDAYLSAGERAQLGVETSFRISELREESWAWALNSNRPPRGPSLPSILMAHAHASENKEQAFIERSTFDYRGAIHTIFEEELRLDPSYTGRPTILSVKPKKKIKRTTVSA